MEAHTWSDLIVAAIAIAIFLGGLLMLFNGVLASQKKP